MAGYGYPYRIYHHYDGFNPQKTGRSHYSEQPCGPAFDDVEGRRFIAGDLCRNTGTYVMKIETTVQRPSQPSGFSTPWTPYQLRLPVPARYNDSDHEKERHKLVTNTIKDEERDRGDLKADKILKPLVTTEASNGAMPVHPTGSMLPSHHNSWERHGPSMELSPPMNHIGTGSSFCGHGWLQNFITLKVTAKGNFILNGIDRRWFCSWAWPSNRREDHSRRGHDMGLEPMNEIGKKMKNQYQLFYKLKLLEECKIQHLIILSLFFPLGPVFSPSIKHVNISMGK
ncbi:hypothetical protein ACJRO7_032857 [Eucalyptus globulus]|uniref:Uncharacterized protein n=1 Tax=Eucalyptus globulus TaxID=34317 RepID=A0ABD3JKY5_EUCGL